MAREMTTGRGKERQSYEQAKSYVFENEDCVATKRVYLQLMKEACIHFNIHYNHTLGKSLLNSLIVYLINCLLIEVLQEKKTANEDNS